MNSSYVKPVLAVMVMLLASVAGFVALSDGSSADAATISITGDSRVATSTAADYVITYTGSDATYVASLTKDGTAVSSGISSGSTGSITNGTPVTITMASQSSAGTYVINIVVTVTDGDTSTSYTQTKNVQVVEPITLKVTLKNNGSSDMYEANIVFYVDGKLVEGSDQTVTVDAGSSEDVSYSYVYPDGFSKGAHTYYVLATDGTTISGIGPDHTITFYYDQGNFDYLNYIFGVLIIVFVIALAYVMRNPVKNRGKPKARKE